MRRSNLAWACLIVGILALSLATMGAKKGKPDLYGHYEELIRIVEQIKEKYVEDVNVDDLFKGAVKGMLQTLPDPYNAFFTGQDLENFKVDTEGEFGGLGIEITLSKQVLTVVTPIVGTPAFQAGVEAGDKIVKIDGKSTENLSLNEAVRKLRGKPGSKVTITIAREGEQKLIDITIVRAMIVVPSLRGVRMLDERAKIGYIWLTNFQENTTAALMKSLQQLLDQGMESLVLDLRYNPGGLLSSAVDVADLFLDEGVVVKTKGRSLSDKREYTAARNTNRVLAKIPIAVLVNQSSASASEIVAGALRDHKRAILVGTHTFGKGSVQTVIPMNEGKARLKLTTARYYTPNDKPILQDKGIEPDIVVKLSLEQQKKLGVFLRKEHIRENADQSDKKKTGKTDAEGVPKGKKGPQDTEKKEEEELTWEDADPQLVRAADVLRAGRIFYKRLLPSAAGKK